MERGFHQRGQSLEKKLTKGEEMISQMNKMASYADADSTQKVPHLLHSSPFLPALSNIVKSLSSSDSVEILLQGG